MTNKWGYFSQKIEKPRNGQTVIFGDALIDMNVHGCRQANLACHDYNRWL